MKNKENIKKLLRTALGLFLITYALNQFFQFLPTSYGMMPEGARNFLDSVAVNLPALYIFEIIIGIFLIMNKWSPFLHIVLFPLSITFLIFSISNHHFGRALPAFIVAALNITLLFLNREKYRVLFKK